MANRIAGFDKKGNRKQAVPRLAAGIPQLRMKSVLGGHIPMDEQKNA
jgi:hypothetical protein